VEITKEKTESCLPRFTLRNTGELNMLRNTSYYKELVKQMKNSIMGA
jgi:hypothetical protein